MSKQRLRPSLFPGCAPFLTFIAPEEEYEEGGEVMENLVMAFTAPLGTSPPIVECFQRVGFKFVEVNLFLFTNRKDDFSGPTVTWLT